MFTAHERRIMGHGLVLGWNVTFGFIMILMLASGQVLPVFFLALQAASALLATAFYAVAALRREIFRRTPESPRHFFLSDRLNGGRFPRKGEPRPRVP